MCGIAGIAGGGPPDPALLEAMAAAMAHRGPDGQGAWLGEEAGLASRRLAIIDPGERSDQPMSFKRWTLVFNGEIYNYRELREELAGRGHTFVTEGDTEVLLQAWAEWGEGALDRLNGMFAFAVWDEVERTLTIARDPLGEKPLYYHQAGGRLAFASELRALRLDPATPAEPDHELLAAYLVRALMPPPDRSFLAGVNRLPAAHLLRWRDGEIELHRYWSPAEVEIPSRYERAVAELRELLHDSVRLRLRSDVPVGTLLSGGVDSSAVVTIAGTVEGEHRRHAFTARFPGFTGDEWPPATKVAEAARVIEHHEVRPSLEGLLEDLDALLAAHGEPCNNPAIYASWCVMRAAREAGVVVLLDGLGGDELFAGYARSPAYALRSGGLSGALRALRERPAVGREVALTLAYDHLPRTIARASRRRAASPYAAPAVVAEGVRAEPGEGPAGPEDSRLRQELLRECFQTVLPHLLRYSDMNSMAHSIEVRAPLLDRRVVEMALSLPPHFAYRHGQTKRILRDAVRDLVPAEVLARGKSGFEMPSEEWLNDPRSRERIGEALLDPAARERGIYDTDAIEADLRAGRWRDPRAVWRALNCELWLNSGV